MKTFRDAAAALLGIFGAAVVGFTSVPATSYFAYQAGVQAPQNAVQFEIRMNAKGERFPLPFETLNGVPVFRVDVNGQQVWAMLDNGVSSSLLDKGFAQSQNLPLGPVTSKLRTPSGALDRQLVHNVTVQVPGQLRFTSPFSAVDLAFLKAATGRPITLVLGKEYFDVLAVLVRPSSSSLELGPSGRLNVPAAVRAIPLTSERPNVEVRMGGKALNLMIDLGYNGDIALTPQAWDALSLNKRPATFGKGANLNGSVYDVKFVKLPSVGIGPMTVNNVSASLRPLRAEDGDGILGLGVLRRFDFALDVKARKLWLIDLKDKPTKPLGN